MSVTLASWWLFCSPLEAGSWPTHSAFHTSGSSSSARLCTLVLLHMLLLFLHLQTGTEEGKSLIKQQNAHLCVWVCVSWCKCSCALCLFVHSVDVTTFTVTVEEAAWRLVRWMQGVTIWPQTLPSEIRKTKFCYIKLCISSRHFSNLLFFSHIL